MPGQVAFPRAVRGRCERGERLEHLDEVRLVREATGVCDPRERQVGPVHVVHGIQVLEVEQGLLGVHPRSFTKDPGEVPGRTAEPFRNGGHGQRDPAFQGQQGIQRLFTRGRTGQPPGQPVREMRDAGAERPFLRELMPQGAE